MGFFFRPGFNVGPIRLNFSSKGVGLSAGGSGARVGVSPGMRPFVGTSVGGAVYRKYLDEGGSGSKKQRQGKQGGAKAATGDEYHFVDSGNTYQSPVQQPKVRKVKPPTIPTIINTPVLLGLLFGTVLCFIYLDYPLSFGFWTSILILAGSITKPVYEKVYNKRAKQQLEALKKHLDSDSPLNSIQTKLKQTKLPNQQAQWRDLWFYVYLVTAYMEGQLTLKASELEALEAELAVPEKTRKQVKQAVFGEVLDQTLEDHVITEDEEVELRELQKVLCLSNDAIEQELKTIKVMADIREQMQQTPEPVEVDVNLKQGETCYYRTEGRILKEKILNRYQANNIIHKEIGYDSEMEGTLYLTDRRVLLVSDGAREYRLNTILDVTLSLEDNTVQLTIEKRKNPVILTTRHTPLMAGKLEQLLELEGA